MATRAEMDFASANIAEIINHSWTYFQCSADPSAFILSRPYTKYTRFPSITSHCIYPRDLTYAAAHKMDCPLYRTTSTLTILTQNGLPSEISHYIYPLATSTRTYAVHKMDCPPYIPYIYTCISHLHLFTYPCDTYTN